MRAGRKPSDMKQSQYSKLFAIAVDISGLKIVIFGLAGCIAISRCLTCTVMANRGLKESKDTRSGGRIFSHIAMLVVQDKDRLGVLDLAAASSAIAIDLIA